ncbi:hypothetical protein [Draconibacterium halophilum]|uniref:Uncharacterized protein n=1 Tax=Draconibacterium halophilum TaxID=2706887 RepID=A0A6C0RFE6_9BACT|nr:hypothetical protein [Draconibacterium halophilum]QIA09130.1 hypothetical protein G0Q07_16015 [Draconibacterium halophilum]
MKRITILLMTILLILTLTKETKAQIIEIKPWHGYYPEMEGAYPLTFIAFSGWLIPIPHVFVRTWPTHYYVEVGALPVTDAGEIAGELKTGLLRLVAKAIERSQMKGRQEETEGIKVNTDFTQQISDKLFDARSDELGDIYKLAAQFIKLYQKVNKLGSHNNSAKIHSIYEKEADQLLMRFLMVNLFQTDHGSKLDAFTKISQELWKLLGELDYTHGKLLFFNSYSSQTLSYAFLSK